MKQYYHLILTSAIIFSFSVKSDTKKKHTIYYTKYSNIYKSLTENDKKASFGMESNNLKARFTATKYSFEESNEIFANYDFFLAYKWKNNQIIVGNYYINFGNGILFGNGSIPNYYNQKLYEAFAFNRGCGLLKGVTYKYQTAQIILSFFLHKKEFPVYLNKTILESIREYPFFFDEKSFLFTESFAGTTIGITKPFQILLLSGYGYTKGLYDDLKGFFSSLFMKFPVKKKLYLQIESGIDTLWRENISFSIGIFQAERKNFILFSYDTNEIPSPHRKKFSYYDIYKKTNLFSNYTKKYDDSLYEISIYASYNQQKDYAYFIDLKYKEEIFIWLQYQISLLIVFQTPFIGSKLFLTIYKGIKTVFETYFHSTNNFYLKSYISLYKRKKPFRLYSINIFYKRWILRESSIYDEPSIYFSVFKEEYEGEDYEIGGETKIHFYSGYISIGIEINNSDEKKIFFKALFLVIN